MYVVYTHQLTYFLENKKITKCFTNFSN